MSNATMKISVALSLFLLTNHIARCEEAAFQEVRRYDAADAVQAVAVDAKHFYAIANTSISKCDKDGTRLKRWTANKDFPLSHLNSGIVREGKLYCAHSNSPHFPETSSIEIWDAGTLEHISSHSLGIYEGSLTWIDWKDDSWWAVFAHYSGKANKDSLGRDNRWTTLVCFDAKWHRQAGWVFPSEVLKRFDPNSCSGGLWGPDGALYCTGHDRPEIYRLELPKAGSTLRLTNTFSAPITGQGIAWDVESKHLYGIDRKHRQVVVSRRRAPR